MKKLYEKPQYRLGRALATFGATATTISKQSGVVAELLDAIAAAPPELRRNLPGNLRNDFRSVADAADELARALRLVAGILEQE